MRLLLNRESLSTGRALACGELGARGSSNWFQVVVRFGTDSPTSHSSVSKQQ